MALGVLVSNQGGRSETLGVTAKRSLQGEQFQLREKLCVGVCVHYPLRRVIGWNTCSPVASVDRPSGGRDHGRDGTALASLACLQ